MFCREIAVVRRSLEPMPALSQWKQPHPFYWLLASWLLVSATAAFDPVNDFCRRFGHQAAVVDRRLYIDGGIMNWKPFSEKSPNATTKPSCIIRPYGAAGGYRYMLTPTDTFLTYNDLDDASTAGMPQLVANLTKNSTIPSTSGGNLWGDSVNKRLYLFGGEYPDHPQPLVLYSYDILYDTWTSLKTPSIDSVSNGAGVSIPERGEAYCYGGWMSSASIPDWSGPPTATGAMVKYEMDSNTWSNITGPDGIRRAEGVMVFLPVGEAGMLVYFGGIQDLHGDGTISPQPLNQVFIYDIANSRWYTEKTSGRTPEIRRRFCAGATWAQDQSSYNIYIYGGLGFPPSTPGYANTSGYDDMYILTIPTFQWIRVYPTGSNLTGAYPKGMATCNVVENAQMLVIGGSYTNDTTNGCDVEAVWGTHNVNLGLENSVDSLWALYQPNLTTYAVPIPILTAVGGRNTGGAISSAPATGFDSPPLSTLLKRKASIATRTATRSIMTPTSRSTAPPPLAGGAIAGIAIGCVAALAVLVVATSCLVIRRRRSNRGGRRDAAKLMGDPGISPGTEPELEDSQLVELYAQSARPELHGTTAHVAELPGRYREPR